MANIDHDKVRVLLIDMRRYVMHHEIPIGECVAWSKLKTMFDVGNDDDAERAWVEEQH